MSRSPRPSDGTQDRVPVLFSDVFEVSQDALEQAGAFNVSLVGDLPLFIDPFLLFNSTKPEYQTLHAEIIAYLRFLRDKTAQGDIDRGLLEAWFFFREVKQTWLGFSLTGNRGSGLGRGFATALHYGFARLFSDDSLQITKGQHLEKLCLIRDRVGRDNISDFTTNLIKGFLLEFTQQIALEHVPVQRRAVFKVAKSRFNFETESWETCSYTLPNLGGDFVLLVPTDMLTRDENWINKQDLLSHTERLPYAMSDHSLRSQVENFIRRALPPRPTEKDRREAARQAILEFPVLIDHYIRSKEESGDRAQSEADRKVSEAQDLFLENFSALPSLLREVGFYDVQGDSYENALQRATFLKHVIENNNGYRLFFDRKGRPIKREEDLHVCYGLAWNGSKFDVNREVDNGRGSVDFTVSKGSDDKTVVEMKLASNPSLRRNLRNQVEVYKAANQTPNAVKVILFFTASEESRVKSILRELRISDDRGVVLIDARRDNKPSASKA